MLTDHTITLYSLFKGTLTFNFLHFFKKFKIMWETAEVRFSNLLNKSHKMLNISANTVRIFLKKTPRGHEANTFLMLPLVFSYIQRLLGFWWICYVKCIFCITFEVSAKIKKSLLGSPNPSNKSVVYKTIDILSRYIFNKSLYLSEKTKMSN